MKFKEDYATKFQLAELEELLDGVNKDLGGKIVKLGFDLQNGVRGGEFREDGLALDTLEGMGTASKVPSNIRQIIKNETEYLYNMFH